VEPRINAHSPRSLSAATGKRDTVLSAIASLMMISGVIWMVTSVRHAFFGIRTGSTPMATYLGAAIGVSYFFAGTLILITKQSAARLALCLLAAVILGHIAMVVADWYSTDSFSQLLAITLATLLACAFFVVVALKWENFA
jgi:FtsH-binding integral membrane protein